MMKWPLGTITISGHASHSLKWSKGATAASSAADNGRASRKPGKIPATGCRGEAEGCEQATLAPKPPRTAARATVQRMAAQEICLSSVSKTVLAQRNVEVHRHFAPLSLAV